MIDNQAQVKVILHPPYLVKKGEIKMPAYAKADVYVGEKKVKNLTLSTTTSARKVLNVELFQLRALSRQRQVPCRIDIAIQEKFIGVEYQKIKAKNERQPVDITYMFPHKFD